ncbi:MAG: hypothetical protein D4R57_00720 [Verrucomicrobiales bacterium]|nr:MAG: hypothetical protein D4R57_00720 [Verrucomicrobiales bacterium]
MMSEWFVNDTRGLEHGFTLKERPAQVATLNPQLSTLNFTLAVRGSLVARVMADGQGVVFCDDSGATVVNYSGLKVWDADGKILPSRFAPLDSRQPSRVTLLVEERDARYPLTIDPIAQQAFLKASNTGAGDLFGISVSVSGDTVVVGAAYEDSSTTGVNSASDESATESGAAYVFVRNGTTWSQQAYLKASNTGTGDRFGNSVSVSGVTMVVGAYQENSNTTGVNSAPNESATQSGAAYVFVRNGTTWSQQAYLKASNTGVNDQFGTSVSVSGDTVVVGAWWEDSNTTSVNGPSNESAPNSGAAYVFVRSGTTWSQQAYLKASNTGAGDLFGVSVSVSGDTVVVGAYQENSSTMGVNSTPNESALSSGAAYVFTGFTGTGANPFALTGLTQLGNGSLQFGFTNSTGVPFTVLTSTNVALPLNQWSNLGPAVETPAASGQFQFTDSQATNHPQRFYRVRSP